MDTRVVRRIESAIAADDDHPYRTGAWRPNLTEYDAFDLDVIEGEIPRDLAGVYLRNTENPVMPAIGRYHPFDGDGMLHAVRFEDGRAEYRNRLVATRGLAEEQRAGEALWAGIVEAPERSLREHGWGARTRMKDASSTDVVVHHGEALTSFYQCGDLYRHDPRTLAPRGVETWGGRFPAEGVSAHARVDERTGELLFFSYSKRAPFLWYGVLDASGALVHHVPVALPGPRLPHDMAFTERFAILNDLPLFWDPQLLERGVHRPRFYRDTPSRFAILPRRGAADTVRWFEASPTYVLHWINAWEEGDEVVLDGYHQSNPMPAHEAGDGPWSALMRSVDVQALGARPHRWRFNLRTGATREERLDDAVSEFPTLHGRHRGVANRYVVAMTNEPGWFLFNGIVRYDREKATAARYQFPKGVFASESPVAPRVGALDEGEAYIVTLVADMVNNRSECQVFDLEDLARGPVARVLLPERVCSGTHSYWHPA